MLFERGGEGDITSAGVRNRIRMYMTRVGNPKNEKEWKRRAQTHMYAESHLSIFEKTKEWSVGSSPSDKRVRPTPPAGVLHIGHIAGGREKYVKRELSEYCVRVAARRSGELGSGEEGRRESRRLT